MILITRQSMANQAAQRWRRQYPAGSGEPATEIYYKLLALGATPNPDDVDRIIGNRSWTEPGYCSECDMGAAALVMVGQEPDYESSTAYLCRECLAKAKDLLP